MGTINLAVTKAELDHCQFGHEFEAPVPYVLLHQR